MNRDHQKIAQGALGHSLQLVVQLATTAIRVPLAMSYFGLVHYGIWLTVTALASYAELTHFGLRGSVTTLLSQSADRRERASIIRQALLLLLAGNAVILVLLGIAFLFLEENLRALFRVDVETQVLAVLVLFILGAVALAKSVTSMGLHAFAGLGSVHVKKLYDAASMVASLTALLVTISVGGGLVQLAAITGALEILVQLSALAHLLRRYPWIYRQTDGFPRHGSSNRRLLGVGAKFFVFNVVNTVALRTDRVILSFFLGPALVAPYAITFRLYQILLLGINSFDAPLWPIFGEMYAKKRWSALTRYYNDFSIIALCLGGAVWLFGVNFADSILTLWVGPAAFAGSAISFCLGSFVFMTAFTSLNHSLINGLGPTRGVTAVVALEGVFNVALSIVLVQSIGAVGAAVSTVVARAATVLWFLPWYIRRRTDRNVTLDARSLFHVVVATALAIGLSVLARLLFDSATAAVLGALILLSFVAVNLQRNPRAWLCLRLLWRSLRTDGRRRGVP